MPGGVCWGSARGCLPEGCLPKGRCLSGVSAQGGVCQGGVHLAPVNRMIDRCENITFPQLRLRTVNIRMYFKRVMTYVRIHEVIGSC